MALLPDGDNNSVVFYRIDHVVSVAINMEGSSKELRDELTKQAMGYITQGRPAPGVPLQRQEEG